MTIKTARKIVSLFIKHGSIKEIDTVRSLIREGLTEIGIEIPERQPLYDIYQEANNLLEVTEGTPEHLSVIYTNKANKIKKLHPFDNQERANALTKLDIEFNAELKKLKNSNEIL